MNRRPIIAGNWKLNLGPSAASTVAKYIAEMNHNNNDVDVIIFPTTIAIPAVVDALSGSGIETGIQDIHTAHHGAYTGCNSATFARESGCTRVLIGHSERRGLFLETGGHVNTKISQAFSAGLLPIVCIGESQDARESDRHFASIEAQLQEALTGLTADELASMVLAYEPIWAIGTGLTATPDIAQSMHHHIRTWIGVHFPKYVGDSIRIQYGGSVKPKNARVLLQCPDIDGALVGGASLNPADFADIIAQA